MTTRPGKGQGVGDQSGVGEKSVFKRGLPLRATGRVPCGTPDDR